MIWRSLRFLFFANLWAFIIGFFGLHYEFANGSEHEAPAEHGAPAGEHGAPEGGEHGEGKKEEGGGHGGSEKAPSQPWTELETKIQTLEAKIQLKKQTLKTLIEEKEHLPEKSPQLKTVTREIGKTDKELRELLEEYEKSMTILKYRFPERHAKGERKYDRNDVPKVEDLEKAIGLDGKLNKSLKKMRSQFPPQPNLKKNSHSPGKKVEPEKAKPDSIEEAPPVIMKK